MFDSTTGDFFDTAFSATVHASSSVTPTYTWDRDGTTLKPANAGDDVQVNSLNGGQLAGFRNQFINGAFGVWQRGTTGASTATYVADRWRNAGGGDAATKSQVSTTAIKNLGFPYG